MDEDRTMTYFERLAATAERIARHAYYPGKGEAVGQCIEDIEGLLLSGRITAEQGGMLREILLGAVSHAA